MSQGQATKYCEYTCETDTDCPEQATCEFNIASRICTYNSGYNTPVPSAPSPTPSSTYNPVPSAPNSRGSCDLLNDRWLVVKIVPADCGTSPCGSPAGHAPGSYCAEE